MHGVLAIGDLVGGGWKWASVNDALVGGVKITCALSTVS